jgi:hypothetical protein
MRFYLIYKILNIKIYIKTLFYSHSYMIRSVRTIIRESILSLVCVLRGVQSGNLTHMLPQHCVNYNDVILIIVSTKKVTLARPNTDSLMMIRTDRIM